MCSTHQEPALPEHMNNIKIRATSQITVQYHMIHALSLLSRHRPGLRVCKNTCMCALDDGSVWFTAVVFSRLKVVISSLLFSFTLFIALLIPVLHGCAHHEIIPQHAPRRILHFHFYRLLISVKKNYKNQSHKSNTVM